MLSEVSNRHGHPVDVDCLGNEPPWRDLKTSCIYDLFYTNTSIDEISFIQQRGRHMHWKLYNVEYCLALKEYFDAVQRQIE